MAKRHLSRELRTSLAFPENFAVGSGRAVVQTVNSFRRPALGHGVVVAVADRSRKLAGEQPLPAAVCRGRADPRHESLQPSPGAA